MTSPKSLILNARLKPLAKNPPNGPIIELNNDNANECHTNGYIDMVCGRPNYSTKEKTIFLQFKNLKFFLKIIITSLKINCNVSGRQYSVNWNSLDGVHLNTLSIGS